MMNETQRSKWREASRRYKERHPDRVRANNKLAVERYQEEHFEKVADLRNRTFSENQKKRRLANPEPFRESERASKHRRRGVLVEDIDREYMEVLLLDPCSYCDERSSTIDHIDAIAKGGTGSWDNLTGSCSSCNSKKYTKSLLGFLCR